MSAKEKRLLISAIVVALFVAVGGSAYYLTQPHESTITVDTTRTTSSSKSELAQANASTSDNHVETPHTEASTPSAAPASTEPRPIAEAKQPQQDSLTANQPQAQTTHQPSCNESMKSSYTYLYTMKITAENTRWSNLVNGFNNAASGRGGSFSGFVQDKISQARPTHEANIASIEAEYRRSLASIACR